MVNCNPETVSTDYDTADRLYFEPLTFEDVLEVVEAERAAGPVAGVICTLGGQTPLGLAQRLKDAGVPVLGTSPEAIDARRAPRRVLPGAARHRPHRPRSTARRRRSPRRGRSPRRSATRCWSGRPTCSAGGGWRSSTTTPPSRPTSPRPPTSAPRTRCWSTGSWRTPSRSTSTPSTTAPTSTSAASWSTSRRPGSTPATPRARCRRSPWARPTCSRSAPRPRSWPPRIGVRGLMNVQYALKDDILYVLEANPRASRTVPFVSKATAVQLAKAAARIAVGGVDRRPARRPVSCRPPATAPTCPRTSRSRSRRRCCPSTGSAPSRATASTPSSARR